MPYYAVRKGKHPGIYMDWSSCEAQVKSFPGAKFKKFNSIIDAESFLKVDNDIPTLAVDLVQSKDNATNNNSSKSVTPQTLSTSKSKKVTYDFVIDSKKTPLPSMAGFQTSKQSAIKEAIKTIKKSVQDLEKNVLNLENLYSNTYDESSLNIVTDSSSKELVVDKTNANLRKDSSKKIKLDNYFIDDCEENSPTIVYTDGCCFKNGHRGASAGIGVFWGPDSPDNISEKLTGRQTNNRAEIHAVIRAVKQAKVKNIKKLQVHTDSQFLINSMTKWLFGWKKNNWKTSDGHDVINRDDFELLIEESRSIDVTWVHVKGHSGIYGNEMADRLANQGANSQSF